MSLTKEEYDEIYLRWGIGGPGQSLSSPPTKARR
jgi:hypothetical protein